MPTTNALGRSRQGSGRTRFSPHSSVEPIPGRPARPVPGTSNRQQWLVTDAEHTRRRSRPQEFPDSIRELTVGRSATCRFRINHPSISRRHAALVRRPRRGVYLKDLGSRDGTFLNGERVVGEILLMDGDRIRLGSEVSFTFVDRPDSPRRGMLRWMRRAWVAASGLMVLGLVLIGIF